MKNSRCAIMEKGVYPNSAQFETCKNKGRLIMSLALSVKTLY